MGVIGDILGTLFGGGGNVVRETAEVFRENAEGRAERASRLSEAALLQFAAEFAAPRQGLFDRVMDGVNRLPRPALALGTLGLFAAAMIDPVWFAERMQGIALVPEPLWWLLGAIVSFYFGARHQTKGQEFQRQIAAALANTETVVANVAALRGLEAGAAPADDRDAEATLAALAPDANPAVEEWRRTHDR